MKHELKLNWLPETWFLDQAATPQEAVAEARRWEDSESPAVRAAAAYVTEEIW